MRHRRHRRPAADFADRHDIDAEFLVAEMERHDFEIGTGLLECVGHDQNSSQFSPEAVVDGTEPGLLPNAPASLPIRAFAGDGVGNEAILAVPILRSGTGSPVPLAAGR
ncbi:hypothetical protein D9M70_602710 [compost metagenome]